CLLYVPTISITNSIAFSNMKDAQKEFGFVRMGGTIGWILAAWPMTFILVDWDKVHATNTQGFVSWLGTVLASGLTGPALQPGIAGNWIMPVMSLGQISEILTMLILGVTLKALGWRATMIVGILGHAARFAVFAFLPQHQSVVILVNLLHGICYAFFFATVYI